MNRRTKSILMRYLAFFVVFLAIWTILYFTFDNLGNPYKGMISAGVSAILVPQIKKIETQSGRQIQMKWKFFKNLF